MGNDPADREDVNEHICRCCGDDKRIDEEYCPSCEADFRNSIREAAEAEVAERLASKLEDIAWLAGQLR